jgi:hypothetical protein
MSIDPRKVNLGYIVFCAAFAIVLQDSAMSTKLTAFAISFAFFLALHLYLQVVDLKSEVKFLQDRVEALRQRARVIHKPTDFLG